jgi:hypothetical protein
MLQGYRASPAFDLASVCLSCSLLLDELCLGDLLLLPTKHCWGETSHEFGRVDIEAGGDANNVVQAEVAHAALNFAESSPVQARQFGKRLLADRESATLITHALAEDPSSVGGNFWHVSLVVAATPLWTECCRPMSLCPILVHQ